MNMSVLIRLVYFDPCSEQHSPGETGASRAGGRDVNPDGADRTNIREDRRGTTGGVTGENQ